MLLINDDDDQDNNTVHISELLFKLFDIVSTGRCNTIIFKMASGLWNGHNNT